jgi:acetyl esterase/lipase
LNLDPELAPIFASMGPLDLISDIPAARAEIRARAAANPMPVDDRFTSRDTAIPGPDDNEIPIRIYTPRGDGPFPALVYMHGGCFITGDLDTAESQCRPIVTGANAVVVSVDYRLAPEHPFPAQLDDSYAVLLWVEEHAGELNVEATRIAVGGRSAGGCLATAMAIKARDEGGPSLVYQLLLVPVTDNALDTQSSYEITDERILNRKTCEAMWGFYLQGESPEAPYAVPMRTGDLSGLPPALVQICENDPLRDEGLAYAQRLLAAHVPTEIQLVPGVWHVFETQAPNSRIATRATANWVEAVNAALHR